VVPNADSTCAAVPDAATVMWSLETAPIVKPFAASHSLASATCASVGENSDSHWAAVT
jgi:hypothetical protein